MESAENGKRTSIFLWEENDFFHASRCDRNRLEKQKEEDRKREFDIRVSSLKSVGLTEPRFREWRFENDNGSNPKLDIARKYVNEWEEMRKKNIGYMVMGPVGTGKSFCRLHSQCPDGARNQCDDDQFFQNPE